VTQAVRQIRCLSNILPERIIRRPTKQVALAPTAMSPSLEGIIRIDTRPARTARRQFSRRRKTFQRKAPTLFVGYGRPVANLKRNPNNRESVRTGLCMKKPIVNVGATIESY